MLVCFTSSHRNAGFDLLDRLERGADEVTAAIRTRPSVRGSVVLATCNRFEAYLDVDAEALEAELGGRAEATASLIRLVGEAKCIENLKI